MALPEKIIIGSRGSDLALWQAYHVKARLADIGIEADIKIIKTQGDQIQHLSFDKLEGKGFFTKEIEEALLKGEIDLAVHSHKDLPTESPAGLIIAAVSEREDSSELLLIQPSKVDITRKFNLAEGAIVGTSSARRKSQLLSFRPDVKIEELRGNVPTRVDKLRKGGYDAIMIAAAGVERLKLDISDLHAERLDNTEFVPAPAQGVLALQIRENDTNLFDLLQKLNNNDVAGTIALERKILNLFDGGCQLPLGVYCKKDKESLKLWASKAASWNSMPLRMYREYPLEAPINVPDEARRIVESINTLKPQRVFITKDLNDASFFRRSLQEHGFTVQAESLIETKAIPFSSLPTTEWVFFSSASGVRHFFEQKPVLKENIKYAVIGKGTELALKQQGAQASFIGDVLHTYKIGRKFEEVAGASSVLFPQAKDSLQSIQKELSFAAKIHNLNVYSVTDKASVSILPSDILVFTSPSNVRAFFAQGHRVDVSQKSIAIGYSTAREMERLGIKNYTLPYASDEVGLATAVFSISLNEKPNA